jgi:hypothetical protein
METIVFSLNCAQEVPTNDGVDFRVSYRTWNPSENQHFPADGIEISAIPASLAENQVVRPDIPELKFSVG